MARLVNGNGIEGITAQIDADFCAGIAGGVTGRLPVGRNMTAEIVNNSPCIYSGVLLTKEGRRIQVDYGTYDTFTIPEGTEGVTRYFLIGYKLTTASNGAQTCSSFVEEMTSESATIPENMLKDGHSEVYINLYRVTQTGTVNTIGECLRTLFRPLETTGTDESDVQTTTLHWSGLTVTISVYRESLVFVSVTGTTTTDLSTRMRWATITTRENICPASDVVGFAIVSGIRSAQYRWTSNGVFQIGNSRSLDDNSAQTISSGFDVNFNFSFMI